MDASRICFLQRWGGMIAVFAILYCVSGVLTYIYCQHISNYLHNYVTQLTPIEFGLQIRFYAKYLIAFSMLLLSCLLIIGHLTLKHNQTTIKSTHS